MWRGTAIFGNRTRFGRGKREISIKSYEEFFVRTKNSSYDLMDISLFPLPNLVLFPNIAVPLHIFEERYKLMINGCIDQSEAFGLVLIRSGATEETEEAIHRVGVAARITGVER